LDVSGNILLALAELYIRLVKNLIDFEMLAVSNRLRCGLAEVEELAYLLLVGRSYETGVVEVSLTLFRLLGKDVAVVSVFPFDLAGAGEGKALFRSGISLYFRHFAKNLVVKISPRHCVPTVSNLAPHRIAILRGVLSIAK
jgi:hypothetical protein